jgi:hypothetical protein
MTKYHINVLTPERLVSCKSGLTILEEIQLMLPEALPDKYGFVEPLRGKFDPSNMAEICADWGDSFFWKNSKTKVEGAIMSSDTVHPLHGWIHITIDCKSINFTKIVLFLKSLSYKIPIDFAMAHKLEEIDLVKGGANGTIFRLNMKKNNYSLSITTHSLRKGIPDFYDFMFFGNKYVELIGSDRINKLNGCDIEFTANNDCLVLRNETSKEDNIAILGKHYFFDKGHDLKDVAIPSFEIRDLDEIERIRWAAVSRLDNIRT